MGKSYVSHIEFININSSFDGWAQELRSFAIENAKQDNYCKSLPSISWVEIGNKLKELKYVCLVDELTFVSIYRDSECYKQENSFLQDLQKLFEEMEQAPEDGYGNDHVMQDFPDTDRLNRRNTRNSNFPSGLNNGDLPEEPCVDKDKERIIDCYGIYTKSLYRILMQKNYPYNNENACKLISKLRNDLASDGPAILLCPELIEKIYAKTVMSVDRSLGVADNPTYSFLKMVYLHELGHHIYQISDRFSLLGEAMANYFAYSFLTPSERNLLFSKTLTQSSVYRSYHGLLLIQYPWTVPLMKFWDGASIGIGGRAEVFIRKLEQALFHGQEILFHEYIKNDIVHAIYNYFHRNNNKHIIQPVTACLLLLADMFDKDIQISSMLFDILRKIEAEKYMLEKNSVYEAWHNKVLHVGRLEVYY